MGVEVFQSKAKVIRATGDIDLSNVGELNAALNDAVKESPDGFIIDLSEVTYIDSAGIAAIISAYQRICPHKGKLALVVKTANVKDILDLIHLNMLPGLFICDDLPCAEAKLSA